MKIFIITMEDPVYTVNFLKDIIQQRNSDIAGIAIAKGGRLKIGNNNSKVLYLLSLLLIMGINHFIKNTFVTLFYFIRKQLSLRLKFISDHSLSGIAANYNIPLIQIDSPNSSNFISYLKEVKPDIIINQSQHIIKKQLLEIPRICVLNRHNALLPKNRGRLTPFWVIYNKEKESGVTIHMVNESIDSGPIIVQKKFTLDSRDTFNTVAKKNYQIASSAMLEALTKIEEGNLSVMDNNSALATYNTIPTLVQAFIYRMRLIKRLFVQSE